MVDLGAGPSRWMTARFWTISCGGAGLVLAAGAGAVQPGDEIAVRFLANGNDVSIPARVANVSGDRIGVAFLLAQADATVRHGVASWIDQQVRSAQSVRNGQQHRAHRVTASARLRAAPYDDR